MDEEDAEDLQSSVDAVAEKVESLGSRMWLFAVVWSVIGGIWLFRHW